MALSYTTNVNSAHRDAKLSNGMRLAQARITVGLAADYQAAGVGLVLTPAGMGFRKIFLILPVTWKTSGGTLKFALWFFDEANNRLRGADAIAAGAAGGTLTELVSTDFGATNDTIDCLVLGV